MKIEIISGSPRNGSITRRVAEYLHTKLTQDSPHSVDLIDMHEWPIPALQAVWRRAEDAPIVFQPLARRIFEADAFILVTPEYNGSYTSALKNLLDHFPKQYRKAFGLVTASQGALGGMRAAQQLLLLVPALFGITSPYLLVVPEVDKKFAADGSLTQESFYNAVHNFTTEFLWLAESIAERKAVQVLQASGV